MDMSKFELNRNKNSLTDKEIKYLDTLSKEEVYEYMNDCKKNNNYYKAMEQGLKLALNSTYGSFGNKHFVCFATDISYGITAMGRDVIRYMDTLNETYWYDHWHNDTELHEKLGIDSSKVGQIDSQWIHRESKSIYDGEVTENDIIEGTYQRKVPVSLYSDTDSGFIGFQPAMDSCNWQGDEQKFVEIISKERLEPLFKKKLESYAKRYKVENLQDFELENISESVMFLAKKKYIKHVVWEEGIQHERLKLLVPKNVSLIKRGTPAFAREKVMDIVLHIFDNHKNVKLNSIMKFIIDQRKQFEMVDNIDDITDMTNVNMYWSNKVIVDGKMIDGPGILKDSGELSMAKGTYYTVKAAGYYNYMLNENPELKVKYEIVKPGVKVKMYPCISDKNDRFCYPVGAYPKEFAPPIDYDTLFEKTVSAQVNMLMPALNFPVLNKRLKVIMPIFD